MDLIPTRQLSDDALVAAAAEGDARAFGELADRHGRWLLSQARKITPDRAEDVAEAALMNAYRSLRSGTRPADLERWLRTIVRNAAITAQEFEGRPTETTRGRSATEGSLRVAVDRARRRLRATVPAPFPFPGLDVARRALARVRDAGPVGGAVAAGAVAATVAAVAFAGGLPGGGDGEPGDLALAQVESPGIVAPPLGRAEPRDAADRGGADRKRSRRGDRRRKGGSSKSAGSAGAPAAQAAAEASAPAPASAPPPSPAASPAAPPSPPASSSPPEPPPSPPPSSPPSSPQPQPPPPEPAPSSGSSCPGPVSCLVDGVGGLLNPGQ